MPYPQYIDYKYAIARGETGHTLTVMPAECTTISTTAILIRPVNTYGMTTPSTPQTMRVSSSDAADATAGTGAVNVQLYGVGTNGASVSENIRMEGQTPVSTVNKYLRMNRVVVNSVGSGKTNAGVIYISEGIGSTAAGVPKATTSVFAVMAIGDGVNKDGKYYVPSSNTAYLSHVGAGGNGSTVIYTTTLYSEKDGIRKKEYTVRFGPGYRRIGFDVPLKFEGGTDLWVEVDNGAASATAANVDLEFVLLDGND
jgi:hypothetical protein